MNVLTSIIVIVLCVLIGYGYIANIIHFTQCDFESSYKAEVIRV